MKIAVPPTSNSSQVPPDLSQQTYTEAKGARETANQILSLLEAPPEGSDEPDPILQLMDLLMKIEQRAIRIEKRIVRIEKRLGIDADA